MNNLSWLLYWADVLPSFAANLQGFAITTLVASAAITFIRCLFDERLFIPRFAYWTVPVAIASILLTTFVPSKQTFYLIAGAEVSEKIVDTPEFNKVRAVINQWLDDHQKDKIHDQTP